MKSSPNVSPNTRKNIWYGGQAKLNEHRINFQNSEEITTKTWHKTIITCLPYSLRTTSRYVPSAASCATIMERNEMSVCKIPTYDTRWMTKKKVGKKIINFLVNQILIQNMPITKKVHPLFSIIFDQNFFPKIFCSVILLIKINKKKLKVFIFFNIFDLLYRFFNV